MTNIIPPVSGSDVLKIDVYTHSSLAVLHHAAPSFCPWEAAGVPLRLFSNREGYGERERDRGDRPNVTLRVTFGAVPAVTFPQGVGVLQLSDEKGLPLRAVPGCTLGYLICR
ncbi:hypothetical protein JRC49_06315 [Clostridiales bacterium FE2011]|nr:hypothetical protein JRC49_06315 [Clostridiales bacterium FE2011]